MKHIANDVVPDYIFHQVCLLIAELPFFYQRSFPCPCVSVINLDVMLPNAGFTELLCQVIQFPSSSQLCLGHLDFRNFSEKGHHSQLEESVLQFKIFVTLKCLLSNFNLIDPHRLYCFLLLANLFLPLNRNQKLQQSLTGPFHFLVPIQHLL